MRSALSHSILSKLDIYGDLCYINNLWDHGISLNYAKKFNKLEYYSKFCVPCVGGPLNKNITRPYKELLRWNRKLGVIMYRIQDFTRELIYEKPNSNRTIIPLIINNKLPVTRNCSVPACQSCMLSHSKKRSN